MFAKRVWKVSVSLWRRRPQYRDLSEVPLVWVALLGGFAFFGCSYYTLTLATALPPYFDALNTAPWDFTAAVVTFLLAITGTVTYFFWFLLQECHQVIRARLLRNSV